MTTPTLSISNDVVYDESFTLDTTDNDVASLSFSLPALGTFLTPPSGFPQYAELNAASFVDVSQLGGPVTDYSLSGWDSIANAPAALSTSTGVATDLYIGSDRIYLFAVSGNSNVVVGRAGTGLATDPIALVIALNETFSGGQVTAASLGMAVYGPLVHSDGTMVDDNDTLNLHNLVSLTASFSTSEEHDFDTFAGVPSGSDAFAMILPDTVNDLQLIATGFSGTNQKITISQDATEGSIGGGGPGQHVASGNSLRIDFVTGGVFSKADTSVEDNNYANIDYGSHTANAFQASFQLVQVNPGTSGVTTSLNIFAYDVVGDSKGLAFATDAIASEGTSVAISVANVHIYDALGVEITPAAGQITSIAGGGIHITGMQTDYTIKFSTPGTTFDRFTVTNTQPAKGSGSNVTFDIGHIHVSTLDSGSGSASAELGTHLVFEDGGPSFGANGSVIPTVQVDETTLGSAGKTTVDFHSLFDPQYGPDGQAASSPITYALGIGSTTGVDSGLQDTASGNEIFLFMQGSDVVGRVGSSATLADSSGQIDFRISVDSDGNVTFQQDYAVVHPGPTVSDEAVGMSAGTAADTAALVTLTATATDGDGDSANSQGLGIGGAFSIKDDEPSSLGTGSNVTVGNNLSASPPSPQLPDTASGAFSNTLTAGNDGLGSFTLLSYDPGTGLTGGPDTSGAFTWAYGSDHSTIIESYTDPTTHVTSQLFSLTLNSSGGVYDGTYTMQMLGTLPLGRLDLGSTIIKAGGPTDGINVVTTNDDGAYVHIGATYNNTNGQLNGTAGAVNASNGNVGVNNGNLDGGEALSFSLFSANNVMIPFFGLDMGTKTAQGASYHLYGVSDAAGHAIIDLGTQSLSKGGVIHYEGTVLLDSIIVEETTGNAVKIGLAGIHLLVPPPDAGFHFAGQLADGDGDTVSSPFNVFIDGNNDGVVDTSHVVFPA